MSRLGEKEDPKLRRLGISVEETSTHWEGERRPTPQGGASGRAKPILVNRFTRCSRIQSIFYFFTPLGSGALGVYERSVGLGLLWLFFACIVFWVLLAGGLAQNQKSAARGSAHTYVVPCSRLGPRLALRLPLDFCWKSRVFGRVMPWWWCVGGCGGGRGRNRMSLAEPLPMDAAIPQRRASAQSKTPAASPHHPPLPRRAQQCGAAAGLYTLHESRSAKTGKAYGAAASPACAGPAKNARAQAPVTPTRGRSVHSLPRPGDLPWR